jgi:hypothetical protein
MNRPKSSFQQKAANIAYVLFGLGILVAILGNVLSSSLLVAAGIAIIAISLIFAIIAFPWMVGF